MSELLKTAEYDLPIKTLALGDGVNKVLTSAAAPKLSCESASAQRANENVLRLCVYGKGVRDGDRFIVPEISYAELWKLFDQAPEKTYSAKNDFFGYRAETGKFLPLDELVETVYGQGGFSVAKMQPDASILVHSGTEVSRIRGSQVCCGGRYYYPLLTSEQILGGMDPADSRGEVLELGLLRTGQDESSYQIIFVIGQRNWNDMNEAWFVNFADGGANIQIEYLPEERKQHNVLFVGPLGGCMGEDVIGYAGDGTTPVHITAKGGALIRFNLDNDDLLNTAHMYYKFTLDEEKCGMPAPNDGFVYNTRIPLYFGGGTHYPSGIILPPAAMHHTMTIHMMMTGIDCPDTEADRFIIHITE